MVKSTELLQKASAPLLLGAAFLVLLYSLFLGNHQVSHAIEISAFSSAIIFSVFLLSNAWVYRLVGKLQVFSWIIWMQLMLAIVMPIITMFLYKPVDDNIWTFLPRSGQEELLQIYFRDSQLFFWTCFLFAFSQYLFVTHLALNLLDRAKFVKPYPIHKTK